MAMENGRFGYKLWRWLRCSIAMFDYQSVLYGFDQAKISKQPVLWLNHFRSKINMCVCVFNQEGVWDSLTWLSKIEDGSSNRYPKQKLDSLSHQTCRFHHFHQRWGWPRKNRSLWLATCLTVHFPLFLHFPLISPCEKKLQQGSLGESPWRTKAVEILGRLPVLHLSWPNCFSPRNSPFLKSMFLRCMFGGIEYPEQVEYVLLMLDVGVRKRSSFPIGC